MLAILAIFGSSIVIALSGAMMPGPLLTVTISETPRRGMWTGPLLIAGHGLLECGLVIGLMLGLAPLLARPEVFALVSVLIWKGRRMLSTRIYRGLMGTCAVLLLVFAGVCGVAGVRQLLLM